MIVAIVPIYTFGFSDRHSLHADCHKDRDVGMPARRSLVFGFRCYHRLNFPASALPSSAAIVENLVGSGLGKCRFHQ